MGSRELILQRLALHAELDAAIPPPVGAEEVFSDLPETSADLFDEFAARLALLKGEAVRVRTAAEAASVLTSILAAAGVTRCLVQQGMLADAVLAGVDTANLRCEFVSSAQVESGREFGAFGAGISEADMLVARSGSVLLRSTTAGGRRLSVLPELHLVVARADMLVRTLAPWLSTIAKDPGWSFAGIITGPSRTADIEKILVLGAHGPKRIVVIVID